MSSFEYVSILFVKKISWRVELVAEEISNGIQSILSLNHWLIFSLGQYKEQKSLHLNGAFACFLPYRRCISCIAIFMHRYPQRACLHWKKFATQANKLMVPQHLMRKIKILWSWMASIDIFICTFRREATNGKSTRIKSSSCS